MTRRRSTETPLPYGMLRHLSKTCGLPNRIALAEHFGFPPTILRGMDTGYRLPPIGMRGFIQLLSYAYLGRIPSKKYDGGCIPRTKLKTIFPRATGAFALPLSSLISRLGLLPYGLDRRGRPEPLQPAYAMQQHPFLQRLNAGTFAQKFLSMQPSPGAPDAALKYLKTKATRCRARHRAYLTMRAANPLSPDLPPPGIMMPSWRAAYIELAHALTNHGYIPPHGQGWPGGLWIRAYGAAEIINHDAPTTYQRPNAKALSDLLAECRAADRPPAPAEVLTLMEPCHEHDMLDWVLLQDLPDHPAVLYPSPWEV